MKEILVKTVIRKKNISEKIMKRPNPPWEGRKVPLQRQDPKNLECYKNKINQN